MSFLLGPLEAGLAGAWMENADVPDLSWINLAQQQLDTARGNLGVLPQAEEMGGQVNDFLRGERAKTIAGAPGVSDIQALQLSNLKSWLRGDLSPDVASQVQRRSNAQSFAGGYGGSGMAGNLTARDLGLTSQQIAQGAMPLASQYAQQQYNMRAIPEFNPASMFIDPMAAAEFNARQRGQQFQRDWLANRVNAQPEPWQQSIMNSVQQGGAIGDSLFSSYLGGAAGGALGGGGARGIMAQPTPANQGYDFSPYSLGGSYYG